MPPSGARHRLFRTSDQDAAHQPVLKDEEMIGPGKASASTELNLNWSRSAKLARIGSQTGISMIPQPNNAVLQAPLNQSLLQELSTPNWQGVLPLFASGQIGSVAAIACLGTDPAHHRETQSQAFAHQQN